MSLESILLSLWVELGLSGTPQNLQFMQPEWLWLIVIWPVLWFLSRWLRCFRLADDDLQALQKHSELRVKHGLIDRWDGAMNPTVKPTWSVSEIGLNLLRGLIVMAFAVALAQPVEKRPPITQPETKTVRDIVFVIESSASFLLPDYQVEGRPETRMNVVKQVLDTFVAGLPGNRFGFTIYADQAFTLLPISADQTLARLTLKRLKPYLAGRTDVAMGEALGLALQQADQGRQTVTNSADKSTRHQVVVLISDGLSLPSRLELSEAVNYAQHLQVPIYSVGVGASSKQADKRLYSGLLYQPLESESLQQIASQTGGVYYQVGSGEEIGTVLEKINQAEGVPYTVPPQPDQYRPLYRYPLLVAAALLALYAIISGVVLMRGRRLPKRLEAERG